MKLLLHICCAPCSIECINILDKKYDITGFWYNPNIHPYTEYISRKESLEAYSKNINLNVIYKDEYGLVNFINNVHDRVEQRCEYCYKIRLDETVKYAKENNYDAFTTTLLISPYQKHESIKNICEQLAKEYNIKFVYYDFRVTFRKGQKKAKEMKLYMQKYCGCIYSEMDRYLNRR